MNLCRSRSRSRSREQIGPKPLAFQWAETGASQIGFGLQILQEKKLDHHLVALAGALVCGGRGFGCCHCLWGSFLGGVWAR